MPSFHEPRWLQRLSSANEEDEREVLIKPSISSVVMRSRGEDLKWFPCGVCVCVCKEKWLCVHGFVNLEASLNDDRFENHTCFCSALVLPPYSSLCCLWTQWRPSETDSIEMPRPIWHCRYLPNDILLMGLSTVSACSTNSSPTKSITSQAGAYVGRSRFHSRLRFTVYFLLQKAHCSRPAQQLNREETVFHWNNRWDCLFHLQPADAQTVRWGAEEPSPYACCLREHHSSITL